MIFRICLAGMLVGLVASAADDAQPGAQEQAPRVISIKNVAPPIVFPIKEADVNGDGKVDDADVTAAENLAADDPYRLRFYEKLTTTWPVYRHIANATALQTTALIRRYVSTCHEHPDAAAVVLVQWDAAITNGLVGGVTWSIIDQETLRDLRSGAKVFILNRKVWMWEIEDREPTRYFGAAPGETA